MPTSASPQFWHAHVYFDAHLRGSALRLREAIATLTEPGLTLGTVNEGPRGPHLAPSYEIAFPTAALGRVVAWLAFNHGEHSVLLHPLTDDEVLDHTARAFWLGERLPLDVKKLEAKANAL